jgi:long-chain fatty acid transport protein
MKNVMTAGAALLLTTSLATAGGLDRGGNAYSVLFEDGNYAQLSFSTVTPEVSGTYPDAPPVIAAGSTGNMAQSYSSAGLALKMAINDQFDVGVFLNQPYGANASYEQGFYNGLNAEWTSNQAAIVGKYEVSPGISVFGGLRAVSSSATIEVPESLPRGAAFSGLAAEIPSSAIPLIPRPGGDAAGFVSTIVAGALLQAQQANPMITQPEIDALSAGLTEQLTPAAEIAAAPLGAVDYSAETDTNTQVGYILGAAYERPEIALRVALTYESGVTHDFKSSETLGVALAADAAGQFDIEMPQSVTLDFQSGIAEDTLAFGSIKWTEWSVWEVRPAVYESVFNSAVTGLDNDVMTYRAGIGRRISDELSVFGRVTYEKANGGEASRLAPTDGSISYGLGGSYAINDVEITGGVEYAILGDATDGSSVEFADNTALGFGLSIGFNF